MNFWCFPEEFLDVLRERFPDFVKNMKDPLKDEYLLPVIADGMLKKGTEFSVLPTNDKWFGVLIRKIRHVLWRVLESCMRKEFIRRICMEI